MFEAHANIAIGADAKVVADEILDTLDEPALKRMASCHGLKTQVAGMSASGGRSTGGKERLSELQLQAQGPAHALEERAAGPVHCKPASSKLMVRPRGRASGLGAPREPWTCRCTRGAAG